LIFLKLFIGILIAWLFGYVIVCWFDAEKKIQALERMALSYLVGQGSLTLLLFMFFLLPIANRITIVTLMVLALFILKMFLDRKRWSFSHFNSFINISRLIKIKNISLFALIIIILFAGITFKVSYSFIEACSKPEYSWDGAGNWTDAGKNYFYADKYWPDKIVKELRNTVNGYPRSLSLMHYWLFSCMGEANDQWSKIIFPIELLCLLIIFYYGLKPVRGHLGALAFTYLLCSTPLFLYHSTIGYADLTKTVYFAGAMIYFYRWLQTKQNYYFWPFAFLAAFTTWIKLEGKALYAIGLALLLFYLWHSCQESLKSKILYIGQYLSLFVIIGLPWQLFTMFIRVPDPQSVISLSFFKYFEFHDKMYSLMFMEGSWGLFWVIFTAALLFFFKRQMKGENLYLFLAILLFYGNLLFIYLFFHNAVNDMVATFNRVLLPIYPVAVFNLGCVIPALTINQEVKI